MTSSIAPPDSALEARLGQIADEFTQRLQHGEQPDIEEYARNNPEIAIVLHQVLAALQVMGSAERDPSSLDASLAAGPAVGCLGDFRILREIGRGGMGIVYEAEQISLSRRVALKVLPFASTLDAKQLQRFKNEAQAAAGLHHTNIVPVYATGCERGVHFYAMQFIEGRTLAAVIEELRAQAQRQRPTKVVQTTPWEKGPELLEELPAAKDSPAHDSWATGPCTSTAQMSEEKSNPTNPELGLSTDKSTKNPARFRVTAQLGIQAADSLEHAHQLGVVHRDIKPANLLVDGRGNLWVTDFGLAHCQGQAAAHNHNDERGSLPPGLLAVSQRGTPLSGRTTLFVGLLPYLEQDNLYKRWDYIDYRKNLAGGTDAVAAQSLRILVCPSDASIDRWFTAEYVGDWSWGNGTYALGSYGGNGGTIGFQFLDPPPSRDGVFYDRSRVRLTDIKDGLSNTFLFGERSHRDREYDRLTAAFDPGSGPLSSWGAWGSAAWDLTSLGDVTLSAAVPINWCVPPLSDPGDYSWEWQRLCAFGSGHPHGANFAIADGSVRFLNESTPLPLLQALSTRAGGEVAVVP